MSQTNPFRTTDWEGRAACARPGVDPQWFDADDTSDDSDDADGNRDAARKVCVVCLVRVDCLAYANIHNVTTSVWGGLLPKERSRMLTPQQRREFARVLEGQGHDSVEIAQRMGVTPRQVRRYLVRSRTQREVV